jgi:hypothetical protein
MSASIKAGCRASLDGLLRRYCSTAYNLLVAAVGYIFLFWCRMSAFEALSMIARALDMILDMGHPLDHCCN